MTIITTMTNITIITIVTMKKFTMSNKSGFKTSPYSNLETGLISLVLFQIWFYAIFLYWVKLLLKWSYFINLDNTLLFDNKDDNF
jgi:hypothetical protein